jgi:hypothetical protein
MSHLAVVSSGAHGHHGAPGGAGMMYGSFGSRGHDGERAQSARPIFIDLHFEDDSDGGAAVIGDTARASGAMAYSRILAGDLGVSTLSIAARGGDGGDGGHGGRGADGHPGHDGRDATRHSHGTDGGPGGPGGCGGDGGSGGAAGSGAPVVLSVPQEDMDLLMLVCSVDVSPGRPGAGGCGGSGGSGGPGGRGGSSYSWTESVERTRTVQRDGRSETETYTDHVHHWHPGGSSGCNGRDGSSGSRGSSGSPGAPGSYAIQVLQQQQKQQDWGGGGRSVPVSFTAPDRYNIIVSQFEPLGSEDGILEPGEEFTLRALTLVNNGAMPTPSAQPLRISVVPNDWIEPASAPALLADVIPAGQGITLDHLAPLRLRLRHAFPLVRNTIPVAFPRLQLACVVSRVNKPFESVNQEHKTLEVRYPLQLSLAYGARAISAKEEAPFVLTLRNVSTQVRA